MSGTMGLRLATLWPLLVARVSSDACLSGPCVPGKNERCSADGYQGAPAFHLMDPSCGENDPNGPVFDPVHGVIHHFFQKHIALTPPGDCCVYGHFVSRDLIHWATLPVAIWNGFDVSRQAATPYDMRTIYTGSATIMPGFAPDGVGAGIIQIYPGLCDRDTWAQCETGTLLAVALPADYENDPLLHNWTKPLYNPIMENTERDPTTAWKTPQGEWRIRTYDQNEYASASDSDVKAGKWYRAGKDESLPKGECPSLYALPGPSPGTEATYEHLRSIGALPTHVFKYSNQTDMRDYVLIFTYTPGEPGKAGHATATPGFEELFAHARRVDAGTFYASKDGHYPPPATAPDGPWRRVNWGWAIVPPDSAQTLPRHVTFNTELHQLEWSPLPEQDQLRQKQLLDMNDTLLPPGDHDLGLPAGSGRQCELEVVFDVENAQGVYGVRVMTAAGVPASGVHFLANFSSSLGSAPWSEVAVSARDVNNSVVATDVLRLRKGETHLTVRVYVDNTFSEVFFQGGRVAMTVTTPSTSAAGASLTASQPIKVTSAQAWTVGSIWVSPETVLQTPRMDRPRQEAVMVL